MADAQSAVAKGEGVNMEDLIHYHALKKRGDMRMLKHSFGTFLESKGLGEFEEYDIMKDDYMRKYTYKILQE